MEQQQRYQSLVNMIREGVKGLQEVDENYSRHFRKAFEIMCLFANEETTELEFAGHLY